MSREASPDTENIASAAPPEPLSRRGGIDHYFAANPWLPRSVPYFVYLLFLAPIGWLGDWSPATVPFVYTLQCGVVAWLLWRYRRLMPELNVRFHWLAVPAGVAMVAAWIALGHAMDSLWPSFFHQTDTGTFYEKMSPAVFGISIALKFIGMGVVVPLFEELFIRSAMLRGTHSVKKTGVGLLQFAADLPLLGDWLIDTRVGQWAMMQPGVFIAQLRDTPVGALTVFSVTASTTVFMLGHHIRDWPGAIVCGIVWCGLLWWTNRPGKEQRGLGPVVWSHGITNVLLLAYVLAVGDWQFI